MAKDLVVPLAPNVWRIPLVRDLVNGFILRDDDGQVTLVDMGLKSSGPKVIAALDAVGAAPSDVIRLLLTHAHPDHADGEVLPIAGGLRVVHTPGHSPGHVSLLHEESRTLITGDAIFNVVGLRWPVKAFCTDFRMTQRTAHRLGELDYDVAAFTHGAELRDRPREAIRRFLGKHRPS